MFYDLAQCLAPSLRGPVATHSQWNENGLRMRGEGGHRNSGPKEHGAPSHEPAWSSSHLPNRVGVKGGGGRCRRAQVLLSSLGQSVLPISSPTHSLIHLGIHVLVNQSFIHLSTHPFTQQFTHLFIDLKNSFKHKDSEARDEDIYE